jgi:alpha-mannosidase
MALKQSEENEQQWILRCYECCGQWADATVQTSLPLVYQGITDGLERPTTEPNEAMQAWQVRSQQFARKTH